MRETTKRVIFEKFDYYLTYRAAKDGDTSSRRAADSLSKIGMRPLTDIVFKAYLFGLFTALCYDIVALLEARGARLQEQVRTWKEFLAVNGKRVDEWVQHAMA